MRRRMKELRKKLKAEKKKVPFQFISAYFLPLAGPFITSLFSRRSRAEAQEAQEIQKSQELFEQQQQQ
jgi:hypothetical protein